MTALVMKNWKLMSHCQTVLNDGARWGCYCFPIECSGPLFAEPLAQSFRSFVCFFPRMNFGNGENVESVGEG